MYSLINYYCYSDDLKKAKEQIEFYEKRCIDIIKKINLSKEEKKDKVDKIQFTISCIKYTFSL
tara:strand:- start:2593 stop:2781 length:189 start_codon:yes stop_codon:yes gene_type:complete